MINTQLSVKGNFMANQLVRKIGCPFRCVSVAGVLIMSALSPQVLAWSPAPEEPESSSGQPAGSDYMVSCNTNYTAGNVDTTSINRICYTSTGSETLIWIPAALDPVAPMEFKDLLAFNNGYRLPTVKELASAVRYFASYNADNKLAYEILEYWRDNSLIPTELLSSTVVNNSVSSVYAVDTTDDNNLIAVDVISVSYNNVLLVKRIPLQFTLLTPGGSCLRYNDTNNSTSVVNCSSKQTGDAWSYNPENHCIYPADKSTPDEDQDTFCIPESGVGNSLVAASDFSHGGWTIDGNKIYYIDGDGNKQYLLHTDTTETNVWSIESIKWPDL
tara:strand:+ start:238 stop:1227 length:990 start_codon:yes stop_codon:yes gene_type:complete